MKPDLKNVLLSFGIVGFLLFAASDAYVRSELSEAYLQKKLLEVSADEREKLLTLQEDIVLDEDDKDEVRVLIATSTETAKRRESSKKIASKQIPTTLSSVDLVQADAAVLKAQQEVEQQKLIDEARQKATLLAEQIAAQQATQAAKDAQAVVIKKESRRSRAS